MTSEKDKMIPVDKCVLDFLTGVHGDRDNPEERKEKIFDEAFDKAYRDMSSHTVSYKDNSFKEKYIDGSSQRCTDNKSAIKNALKEFIRPEFDRLLRDAPNSDYDYDGWHKSVCEKIVSEAGGISVKVDNGEDSHRMSDILQHQILGSKINTVFTYGQAQKLVNMMMKYLYIYYMCEGWKDLRGLCKKLYVPIDRYVLTASINKDRFTPSGKMPTPWSQINEYGDYLACQKAITEAVHSPESKYYSKYSAYTAFEWELAEWPFKKEDRS